MSERLKKTLHLFSRPSDSPSASSHGLRSLHYLRYHYRAYASGQDRGATSVQCNMISWVYRTGGDRARVLPTLFTTDQLRNLRGPA